MGNAIGPVLLGILISVLGISNMKRNISSIHWYHRKRVTEENKAAFGKLMGLGTLVIGIAAIVYGVLAFAAEKLQTEVLLPVGGGLLLAAVVVGLGLNFYAMFKYNKGIF